MILGAVLAGGQSRRFGSDKAVALWRGRPLLDHACSLAAQVADAVVICGREQGPVPAIGDRPAGGRGPLGGLNAALHFARAHGHARVLSIPCDTPTIAVDRLRELVAATGPTYLATAPVIGCWPSTLADALDHFLATDERCSMRGWAASVGAVAIACEAVPNINAPRDLTALG